MSQPNANQDLPFELKGGMFPLTVLRLLRVDHDTIADLLAAKVAQAPAMFQNAPVIIDLLEVSGLDQSVDISHISGLLWEQGMVPVAVRNGNPIQEQAAVAMGIGVLNPEKQKPAKGKPAPESQPEPEPPAEPEAVPSAAPSEAQMKPARIIEGNIRSGQRIYARESDLVVIGSVSPGSELIADGCIHVYGNLNGRAMAGVKGDAEARIFCSVLGAELVAIAGCY